MTEGTKSSKSEGGVHFFMDLLAENRVSLSRYGLIDVSGKGFKDLRFIKTQPKMKTLNISNTSVSSLESLEKQPNLKKLDASKTQISSFAGMSNLSTVTWLDLSGTPISQSDNFELKCSILCGAQLSVLNRKEIPMETRRLAADFPPITKKLIESGYEVTPTIPDADELRELCGTYNITNVAKSDLQRPKITSFSADDGFRRKDEFMRKDESGSEEEEYNKNDDEALIVDIGNTLRNIGIETGNDKEKTVKAVKCLVDALEQIR